MGPSLELWRRRRREWERPASPSNSREMDIIDGPMRVESSSSFSSRTSSAESSCSEEDEDEELMELTIHQVISTIEFVLGTVSHTASYLRLWALSLAHQQLSQVLVERLLLPALSRSNTACVACSVFVIMPVFIGCTGGLLCGMDSLECALHALRLHWVEFQSKFFYADGRPFKPFCHRRILACASDTP